MTTARVLNPSVNRITLTKAVPITIGTLRSLTDVNVAVGLGDQWTLIYDQANNQFIFAQSSIGIIGTVFQQANAAYVQANTANALAYQANVNATAAFAQANAAYNAANSAASVAGNVFSNIIISGTDSKFNWTIAGNADIIANATANLVRFISGVGIEIDTDVPNNAIRFVTGAFAQANAAQTVAIEAFAIANQANILAGEAFNQANTAYNEANIIFNSANAAFGEANSVNANLILAWATANLGATNAVAAFAQANAAQTVAIEAFTAANSANTLAAEVFGVANGAISNLTIAWGTANGGYTQANSAQTLAIEVFAAANQANLLAAEVYNVVNNAFGKSNASFNVYLTGTNVGYNWTQTGNASINANATSNLLKFVSGNGIVLFTDVANDAILFTDGGAYGYANSVGSNLTLAWGQANNAQTVAIEAFTQANSAQTVAIEAFTAANSANTLAAEVFGVANGIATNTASAWNQANTAYNEANLIFGVSNAAFAQANAAQTLTIQVYAQSNLEFNAINAAFAQANAARYTDNAYGNIAISNTDSHYTWTQGGNVYLQANNTSNTLNLISGAGIVLFADPVNNAIRINSTATGTGTVSNAFANLYFSNTDVNFNWTAVGNIGFTANATSNVLEFISGGGIAIYYDAQNSAVRINSTATGTGTGSATLLISDGPPAGPNTSNTLWWESNTGFLKVWYVDSNGGQWVDASPNGGAAANTPYAFANIELTGTDSGYNWTKAGNVNITANSTSNQVLFVAGSGIELDLDAPNSAIRIVSTGGVAINDTIINSLIYG